MRVKETKNRGRGGKAKANGKDQERVVRLTDQNYFINRICNLEKRFSKSSAYLYAAVGYIEKKQINRNINLAGTRGNRLLVRMDQEPMS